MKKFISWIRNLFNSNHRAQVDETPPVVTVPPVEPLPEIPTEEEVTLFPYLKDGDHGIDISHHNSNVDLAAIEQNFIYMKATEGVSFVSPVHAARMRAALLLKKNCGSYHYYKPKLDPLEQAEHFCRNLTGNMNPVLDLEDPYDSGPQLIKDIKIFLDYVENYTGKVPVIYTGYYYILGLKLPAEFARYPLWLAWYTTSDKVKAPAPWAQWTFWQYSETAQVKGVGKCDVNWYNKV